MPSECILKIFSTVVKHEQIMLFFVCIWRFHSCGRFLIFVRMKSLNGLAIFFLFSFLFTCSSGYEEAERKFWLNHQYQGLNYYDTTDKDKKINDFIINGSVLQTQNKYAEAILEFQQALKYDSSAAILYAISKSYLKLDKYNLAAEYALYSLKKDDKFVPNYDLLAEVYIKQYDIQNAISALQTASKIEETEARLFALARVYEYKDINKSIEYYQIIFDKYKNDYALFAILELTRNSKNRNIYFNTLTTLAKEFPNEAKYANELVSYWLENNQYDTLIKHFQLFDTQIIYKDLAVLYGIVVDRLIYDTVYANTTQKKAILDKIDNRFRFDWQINFLSGNLAVSIQDTSNAKKYFDRAIPIADSVYDLPLKVAVIYETYGYKDKAVNLLEEYTAKKPDNWLYPMFVGMYYLIDKKLDEALKYSKIAYNRNNSQVDILGQLANIYSELKRHDSSDIYFMKALAAEPDNALINNNYAYSLCNRNLYLDSALKYSKIAITQNPNNSAYLDTYGWVNYVLGNYQVALEYVMKSIELGENSAEVFEHLSDINLKLNQYEDAETAINKALELEPQNQVLLQKKSRLSR